MVAFGATAELLGDSPDLVLAALGIVHNDEQSLLVAVRDQLIKGLPALLQRRIHLLMRALEKTRHPAFGA